MSTSPPRSPVPGGIPPGAPEAPPSSDAIESAGAAMSAGGAPRGVLVAVETLGKAGVAVLGVVYALGLAVVTLHVASYGASGLGLLHEQYVLAGVWALLPLGATGFAFAVIAAAALMEFGEMKADAASTLWQRWRLIGRKTWEAALASAAWFIIAGFFLRFLTPQIYSAGGASVGLWTVAKIGAHVVGFAAALTVFAIGGLATFVTTEKRLQAAGSVLLGAALFVLVGYLGYFTASVYPLIPAAVGGGEPRRIHIVLKSDTNATSAAALLDGSAAAPLAEHRLLFATDKS